MSSPADVSSLARRGRRLQWATVAWNSTEVFVTIALGVAANSLALVAFGLDSLVEVFASLVVIRHLGGDPNDPERRPEHQRDRRSTRLVAVAFGVLAAYLATSSVLALAGREEPASSPVGIAYLAVTAIVMFGLARWKRRVGRELASSPFLAEAAMTFLDGCLATSILTALALNTFLGWWWADALAALIIGAVAAREGYTTWRET